MSVFDDNEILENADKARLGELIENFNKIHSYKRKEFIDFVNKSKKTKIFDMMGNIVSVGDLVIYAPREFGAVPRLAKIDKITPQQISIIYIDKKEHLDSGGRFGGRVYANTVIKIDAEQLETIIDKYKNYGII